MCYVIWNKIIKRNLFIFFLILFYFYSSSFVQAYSCNDIFVKEELKKVTLEDKIQSLINSLGKEKFIDQYRQVTGYLKLSKQLSEFEDSPKSIYLSVLEILGHDLASFSASSWSFFHLLWNKPFNGSTKLFQIFVDSSLNPKNNLITKDGEAIFLLGKESIFIQNPKGFENFVDHVFQGDREKAINIAKALFSREQLKEELSWSEVLKEIKPESAEEMFLRSFGLMNLAQKETKQSLSELSDAHKETEKSLSELSDAHKKTEKSLSELSDAHKETEKAAKEASEAAKEASEAAKEASEAAKVANAIVSKFGRNMGELMESLVEGNLIEVLNRREIDVFSLKYNVEEDFKPKDLFNDRPLSTFPTKDKNGIEMKRIKREFDIIALGENDVVFVEVKTHLHESNVDYFLKILSVIHLFFPKYKDMKIHGAMGFLRATEEALRDAETANLLLIQVPKAYTAEIINPKDFQPADFTQIEFFINHLFQESLLDLFQSQQVNVIRLVETDTVHVIKAKESIEEDQRRRFGAVLSGEGHSVVLEKKITLNQKDIQDFLSALNFAPQFFHTLQNDKIFGALAYEEISLEAKWEADAQGLFLIQVSKTDPLKLENSDSFEKRNFNPLVNEKLF